MSAVVATLLAFLGCSIHSDGRRAGVSTFCCGYVLFSWKLDLRYLFVG